MNKSASETGPNSGGSDKAVQWIRADDERFRFAGAVSLQISERGHILPLRVERANLALHSPSLIDAASVPTGVRLCFETDSRTLKIDVDRRASNTGLGDAPFELVVADQEFGQVSPSQHAQTRTATRTETDYPSFRGLPGTRTPLELWLPHTGISTIRGLGIDAGASIWPTAITTPDRAQPRWIAYGSSLTQSRFASSPLQTWPSLVARRLGLDLSNRGYAGQAHLDPLLASEIRGSDADLITLCLGINPVLTGSLNLRTFRANAIGFVSTIREAHPTTPILLMSPLWANRFERQPPTPKLIPSLVRRGLQTIPPLRGHLGLSLEDCRTEVREIALVLDEHFAGSTTYLDGTDILQTGEEQLLEDGLHLTPEGEHMVADRIEPHIQALVPR